MKKESEVDKYSFILGRIKKNVGTFSINPPPGQKEDQWACEGCNKANASAILTSPFLRHNSPEHGRIRRRVLQTLPGQPINEPACSDFPIWVTTLGDTGQGLGTGAAAEREPQHCAKNSGSRAQFTPTRLPPY